MTFSDVFKNDVFNFDVQNDKSYLHERTCVHDWKRYSKSDSAVHGTYELDLEKNTIILSQKFIIA